MPKETKFPELKNRQWLYQEYIVKHQSDKEIGQKIGCSGSNVWKARHSLGILDKGHLHMRGHDTGNSFVNPKGYVFVYMPSHPNANKGCIARHRLMMSKHLGRPLSSNEIVHHVNGIPGDDRIENLTVVTRGNHWEQDTAWRLFKWAKDNPAEAKELLEVLCAPSETERLDSYNGDATVRTS